MNFYLTVSNKLYYIKNVKAYKQGYLKIALPTIFFQEGLNY